MQATKIDTKTYMYHYKKTPLFSRPLKKGFIGLVI